MAYYGFFLSGFDMRMISGPYHLKIADRPVQIPLIVGTDMNAKRMKKSIAYIQILYSIVFEY